VGLLGADMYDGRVVPLRPDLRKRRGAKRWGQNCYSHMIIRRIAE
jgi:hypothetical protein